MFGERLALRALGPDVAVVEAGGETERAVEAGEVAELDERERARVGPIEIELAAPETLAPHLAPWDPVELDQAMAQGPGALARFRASDEVWLRLRSRIRPEDVLVALEGDDELALFVPGGALDDARVLLSGLPVTDEGLVETGSSTPTDALRAARAEAGAPHEGPPPEEDPESTLEGSEAPMSLREEMAALERRRILEALSTHGTQTEAARALGVPLRTFLNRMDALGIPRARKK